MNRLETQTEDLKKRIETVLKLLKQERQMYLTPVKELKKKDAGYYEWNQASETSGGWEKFAGGSCLAGEDLHCCFQAEIILPSTFTGKTAAVCVHTGAVDIWNTDNPQFLVFVDGIMKCALDMNHQEVILTGEARERQHFTLGFFAYTNSSNASLFFEVNAYAINKKVEELYYDMKVPFETATLLRGESLEKLQTIKVLAETVNLLDLRKGGSEAFYRSVEAALDFLHKNYYEILCTKQPITVHSIGHTHIDVAWKWPLRQTREKVIRSFKTVLYLMEQYPEYKFMSSQPQLYEFVKEGSAEIFEEIKQKIREGRWETEGAMWLEADCNLISGESLVRQILMGKEFFRREFGKEENKILWLPDVFGYSGALPQIMKKSGIRYFMTTKIAWNEYNRIPNDVMLWRGIDGSEILTYFITTRNYETYPELNPNPAISTTYNGRQNASQVMGTWQRFQNKDLTQEVLTCYGFGDGGGGPTAEMLEESRRMEKGIPGCPVTRQTFAREYFELLEKNLAGKCIPKWSGEFYLETHRGTYTSMARNKRCNRLSEFKNTEAELFSMMDILLDGRYPYPKEELQRTWKLTLLNQFHDILPGSSIKEVYEESQHQYLEVLSITDNLINRALNSMAERLFIEAGETGAFIVKEKKQYLLVWNQLGFERDSIVRLPFYNLEAGQQIPCQVYNMDRQLPLQRSADGSLICRVKRIPPKGFCILDIRKMEEPEDFETKKVTEEPEDLGAVKVTEKAGAPETAEDREAAEENRREQLEVDTPFYIIKLNAAAEFISLYDKEADRELVQEGKTANELIVFEDRPYEYDAWNIDSTYREKYWRVGESLNLHITENGAVRTCIRVVRKFLDSVIDQNIILYPDSRRIDFETSVDWKESQLLLKAAFPMELVTDKATCEIQFGNVERPTHSNTSWEEAKFEVCAHKWTDISEGDYGAALLNDCKYGYDIRESVMRLTLIKSGIFPNPEADRDRHTFTYSLLPHNGDYRRGGVVQSAYDLNCPPYARIIRTDKVCRKWAWSMFGTDCENVILETVKMAENSVNIIIRLYEAYGKRCRTTVSSPLIEKNLVWECNLMEEEIDAPDLMVQAGSFSAIVKPFEIKTFMIKRSCHSVI